MNKTRLGLGLTLAAALALQACGGGGGNPSTDNNNGGDTQITPSSTATVQGVVYDASTGQALSGAQVNVAGQVLSTDAQGQFSVATRTGQDILLVATRAGYTNSQTIVNMASTSAGTKVVINLTKAGATQVVNVTTGGTASVPGSTAQVTLPAAGLVDGQGKAASGNVNVTITPIDPAAQTRAMPGTFKANDGQSIESFGAIQVSLTDASGSRLQLAAGKTATIRIPLKTRSLDTPATIPLYYLNETTGLWVQEGSATLKGDAGTGLYYEGTVGHFSTWNADRPITETVFVEGCVRNADNGIPTQPVTVLTDGLDYSGAAFANVAKDGTFKVALKRNARATLLAESADTSSVPVALSPANADSKRSECLVLNAAPALPVFVLQPIAPGQLIEGGGGLLIANARGMGQVRYQWRRDGVDVPGQTAPILVLSGLTLADNGARYTVVASNQAGSVTSSELVLSVTPGTQVAQQTAFINLLDAIDQLIPMSAAPSMTVDFDTARMLTASSVCASGGLSTFNLDNKAVSGGEALSPSVAHNLKVTFANCQTTQNGDGVGTLTGSSVSDFSYTTAGTIDATTRLSALTDADKGLQVSGQFTTALNLNSMTLTPASGATVTHLTGPSSSNTLTITGGSLIGTVAGSFTYQNVHFTFNNVDYVLSGGFSTPATPSDAIVLQANGQTIGRMVFDANTRGMKLETTGAIPVF